MEIDFPQINVYRFFTVERLDSKLEAVKKEIHC